jgi:CHAD domain-containing protein
MVHLSKWIDGISADSSVTDAARLSLEARFAAVNYWLPLAARQVDDDVEKVHQLRVSTRRATAALKLYRDWLPHKSARWLKKRLGKIRRAAGKARDLDVLAMRLERDWGEDAKALLPLVSAKRSAAQPKIASVADSCHRKDKLRRYVDRALAKVRPRGANARRLDPSFSDWAAARLRLAADRFFAASPGDSAGMKQLHQFRIAGKRLRYSMELLAPAFGPEFRNEHYKTVEQLQDMLGRVNDFFTGRQHLDEFRVAISQPERCALVDRLAAEQESHFQAAIAEFYSWWTADRADALRRALLEAADRASAPHETIADHQITEEPASDPSAVGPR